MQETLDEPEQQVLIQSPTIREVKNDDLFFDLLPDDWRSCILPFWSDYKASTRIFCLYDEEVILGGGLIFSKPAPDTLIYKSLATKLFGQGYLYIGFLWIAPDQRGKGLGSLWLEGVKAQFPSNRFWLAIEEEDLKSFYLQNGFEIKREILKADGSPDWIFVERAR